MTEPFMDRLVDWQSFELFVRDLYAQDPDLKVEHDVTQAGKSGARRQIDVTFTHNAGGHTYLTIVECKRWKEKITRARIDVLAATIEDLNASKGVMFTTVGYEAGAETYAKHKGIDLFLVRDLTDPEWGHPGRVVWFYWHLYAGEIVSVAPSRASLVAIVDQPPSDHKLEFVVKQGMKPDPAMTLYSVVDASPGANLTSLIVEAQQRALGVLSHSVEVFGEGADRATKAFLVPLILDLSAQPHRQLLRSYGGLRLDQISMELAVSVFQSRFEHDRGQRLNLAVAVENYVTRHRRVVSRQRDATNVHIHDLTAAPDQAPPSDALQNGTLFRVIAEPWVKRDSSATPPERTRTLTLWLPDWDASVAGQTRV